MKLFIVVFSDREEFDSPDIFHIRANDRNEAIIKAGKKLGFEDIEDIDMTVENNDNLDYLAYEVNEEDIIE